MKIAVLSDIHSNMEALEAVLADAKAQGANGFVVAGDLLTDGPSPMDVLKTVRSLPCPAVKGNREDYLLRYRNGERAHWDESRQMASVVWTCNNLDEESFDYIAGLPEQAVMNLEGGLALRIVHGSPFSVYELLKPDENWAAVERAALAVTEQSLVFGHNHMQWTGTVHGRLLLNPGSVGVHFNRDCMAEYGILNVNSGTLSAELRRAPYDFTTLERRLETSGSMAAAPAWTRITFEGVKAGINYCLSFLAEANASMRDNGIAPGPIPNDIWDGVARKWWARMGWGHYPDS